jgi:MFS family permease
MESWTKFKQILRSIGPFRTSSEETTASQDYVKYKHISDGDEATNDLSADLFKSRSIDEILDDIGLRLSHFKVFLIMGFVNITDSIEVSMLSIILPSLKSNWNLSSLLAGVLTLSLSSGIIIGSWFWGWIADKFGRKRGFIGSATFILVFGFASAFSPNYYWLWISLFLVGFGVATVFQTYVTILEFFPLKYRCAVSVLNSAVWTLGFLLSALISIELSEIGFRWVLAIVCFPSAMFLIGIAFLPDTPYYHLVAGDEQKALNVLQYIAPEMDLSNTKLKREPESKRADITQLFRSGYWKITTCASIVALCSELSYYALVFTASEAGSRKNTTSTIDSLGNDELGSSNDALHSTMAWMNLPEMAILITAAIGCYFFTVKNIVLTLIFLPIITQIVALFVLKERSALLVVTMLSRSLVVTAVSVVVIYTSLLYPTANRSLGVGFCISIGHVGMVLGPFIFETLFAHAYSYGIVFNIGILLLGFIATTLLPSRSSATLG